MGVGVGTEVVTLPHQCWWVHVLLSSMAETLEGDGWGQGRGKKYIRFRASERAAPSSHAGMTTQSSTSTVATTGCVAGRSSMFTSPRGPQSWPGCSDMITSVRMLVWPWHRAQEVVRRNLCSTPTLLLPLTRV